MKKHYLILIVFGLILQFSQAQNGFVNSGNTITNSNGSVSFSLGQVHYITSSSETHYIEQGIQQSYDIIPTLGITNLNIDASFSFYPNPTKDILTIKISENLQHKRYQIIDINGKTILTNPINSTKTNIAMHSFHSGMYILNIYDQSKLLKSFKIIKQ
jgi:hypothetical protein